MARKKAQAIVEEPIEIEESMGTVELSINSTSPDQSGIELRFLPIDLVIPNATNVNVEDDSTFNRLQDEISDVGMIVPIQVVPIEDGTYRIIGGEHRWRAAKNLQHETIAAVVLTDEKWKESDLREFVGMRLNMIRGQSDPDKFIKFYDRMAAKYGQEAMQRLIGVTDQKAFQKMVGWVTKGIKKGLPQEMHKQIDEATKEASTVEDLQRIIQQLFQQYGDTVSKSFMIFSYGKQDHVYVSMDARMRAAVSKLTTYCKLTNKDINDVMSPILETGVKSLSKEIDEAKSKQRNTEPGF